MIRAFARRFGMVAVLGLLFCAAIPAANPPATVVRISGDRRISFNQHWRFHKGEATGAENSSFDDSNWPEVRLPHDWAIEGPFDPKLNPHTGALPISGTGWYRKTFSLPDTAKGRYFSIAFDGAMSNAVVWLNGHELGRRPYGYSSFSFDLTPYLRFGNQDNVLAVCLAPEEHSSRWYPGAGIYRNVWLDVTGPVHVAHWGTYVTTPEVSDAQATVSVRTQVENRRTTEATVVLRSSILDESGSLVTKFDSAATSIPSANAQTVPTTLNLSQPHRWDVNHPGRAGSCREPPRHRAAIANIENGGRKRSPHQSQSAFTRTARIL
jgi:beta-galactosidase